MIIIACVDDNMGMMFNKRRQSRDSALTDKVCDITKESTLWIKEYSKTLFGEEEHIKTDNDCLKKAGAGEFCFIEDENCASAEVEKIILFKWNRVYPADMHFGIDVESGFELEQSFEFEGSSHEKITMEVYLK